MAKQLTIWCLVLIMLVFSQINAFTKPKLDFTKYQFNEGKTCLINPTDDIISKITIFIEGNYVSASDFLSQNTARRLDIYEADFDGDNIKELIVFPRIESSGYSGYKPTILKPDGEGYKIVYVSSNLGSNKNFFILEDIRDLNGDKTQDIIVYETGGASWWETEVIYFDGQEYKSQIFKIIAIKKFNKDKNYELIVSSDASVEENKKVCHANYTYWSDVYSV